MICGHQPDRPVPGCKFCRHVAAGGRYADLFRNPPKAAGPVAGRPPLKEQDVPCPHRGAVLEHGHGCCGGNGSVFDCDLHDRCVLTAVAGKTKPGFPACDVCPDRPVVETVSTLRVLPPKPVPVLALAPPPRERPGGRCVATCAVGPVGRAWLAVTGPHLGAYAARLGVPFEVITGPDGDPYPLRHKWRLADLLGRYDRVAYIDADAIPAPDCPDLFEAVPESHVGVLDDWPHLERTAWIGPEIEAIRRAVGRPGPPVRTCYNTGVLVLSAIHRPLFEPPDRPIPGFHCAEQHWFNVRVQETGLPVFALPPELHWHPFVDPRRERLASAKLVHLAGEPDRAAKLRQLADRLYPPA
jgi:hypothetical protein